MMELFRVYMILIVSPPEIANSGPPPVFNRDELILTSQSNLLLSSPTLLIVIGDGTAGRLGAEGSL